MEYELFSELQDIEEVSKQITAYISKNKLSVDFNGERHILASGWSYAGHLFGLTAVPAAPVKEVSNEVVTILYKDKVSNGKKSLMPYCATTLAEQVEQATREKPVHMKKVKYISYTCACEIVQVSTGKIVSRGFGLCSNTELSLCGFDEYSLLSMSQTRSIAKGYRNLLGHVMLNSGFSDTPAEEMNEDHLKDTAKQSTAEDAIEEIKNIVTLEALDTFVSSLPWLAEKVEFVQAVKMREKQLTK